MAETNVLTFPCILPRFVSYLEQRLPGGDSSGMSQVFDSLVQRFLNVERYANDIRYVKYCIKCVSLIEILWHILQQSHDHSWFASHYRTLHHFILSYRRVITRTLSRCTVMSTVRVSETGLLLSTWPGQSSLNRGGWMNRLRLCTRKQCRTKPSQQTLFSVNTGNNILMEK